MGNDPKTELVKRRLRQTRNRLALSQRQAAERAGISKSVVEKYESRDNERIPNTRQIFRLAETYGVAIDYLLGRTDLPQCDRYLNDASAGLTQDDPPVFVDGDSKIARDAVHGSS